MIKIALVDGNWIKGAKEEPKHCYSDGELQKRVEEFSKAHKVVDIQPFADKMILIKYEE